MTQQLHRFASRGAAARLFKERGPEVLLAGPAGTGKSRGMLEKLLMMMLLNPGARGLMVRKTATSLTSTGIVTWERDVIADALRDGSVRFFSGSARAPAAYLFSNGSTVVIGGMDRAEKIMSSEYDVIYVQEATELVENDWELLGTRLRNNVISFQQLMADCNPAHPTHWLNERSKAGKTLQIPSRHEDNPTLFDDDGKITAKGAAYLDRLDALTGVRHARLRKGVWAAADGLIYEGWDDARHLVDRFEVPRDWTRYWSADFGFTNPFVLQDWAEDPDGRLYLVREIYHTGKNADEIARWWLEIHEPEWRAGTTPRPRSVVTDHEAGTRDLFSKALGIGTKPAKKNVVEGIELVQKRLRIPDDGKPRLAIMRDACVKKDQSLVDAKRPTCTADEIPGYVWANKGKDEPVKEDDHGCDAKRYLVEEVDNRQVARVRGWG
jgi:phage terminase large subunit